MYPTDKHIIGQIHSSIEEDLLRIGLFFRVFARVKSRESIAKKLSEKQEEYTAEHRKMQDAFGLRIVVYFNDDIESARLAVNKTYNERSQDSSIDELLDEKFGPTKYNVIYDLPNELSRVSTIINQSELIDNTFEVQYRTILSEGWHEVEHDLRYKCKKEWKGYTKHSRSLNGIYATLENSDQSMINIINDLAYRNYKNKEWNALIRNSLRIRFLDSDLSNEIKDIFSKDPIIGRTVLNIDRYLFLKALIRTGYDLPLSQSNIIFFINRVFIRNDNLMRLENDTLRLYFDKMDISSINGH
jgi:ppGpp synthetase/RelA/SpoT-type nucleotidyltranferase